MMLITIDEKDSRPLYLQITGQVKEQVRKGILRPGDELPSVRELAESLEINMHTVRGAYLKLRDQGIITMRLGRKARIAVPDRQENTPEMEKDITFRLNEIITDALLMGYKPADIRSLVEQQIEEISNEQ
jgi:GntR family transcriptional regulator